MMDAPRLPDPVMVNAYAKTAVGLILVGVVVYLIVVRGENLVEIHTLILLALGLRDTAIGGTSAIANRNGQG
jgi:hypothetical protein